MSMAKHRSGYVRIDVTEILNEIEDGILLEELESRKLITTPSGESYDQDLVKEAFHELRIGRHAEALSILDRLLNPKWVTPKACASDYAKQHGKML
jgi:hypothetical protein